MSFILAVIAGFVTPMVEPTINGVLHKAQNDDIKIEENEYKTLTFGVLLIGVAILASLFDASTHALTILIGGVLGLFIMRIYNALKAKVINKPEPKADEPEEG